MASTITFQCYSCNQVLKVGSDKAGKKAKCIKCGTILTIPVSSEEEEIEEVRSGPPRKSSPRDEEVDEDRPRKRRREEEDEEEDRPRKRRRDEEEDEDDDDRPRKRRSRDDDDEDDDDDRPRSRRRRDDDDDDDDDRPRKRGRDRDEDDDDDYDRPRRKKGGGGSPWPKVRVGMLLEFITSTMLIGYSGCMLLGTILITLAILARSIGMLDFGSVLFKIGMVLYIALQFPAVTGYVFTIFTPNKKGALGLGITSLVLGAINLVIKIMFFLIPFFGARGDMMAGGGGIGGAGMLPIVSTGSVAMAIILMILFIILLDSEYVLYPLYLRSVSQQLKERWLETGCIRAMAFACGVIGGKLILVLLTLVIGSSRGGPSPAMGYVILFLALCVLGIMLAFAIMYMKVIGEVKSRTD